MKRNIIILITLSIFAIVSPGWASDMHSAHSDGISHESMQDSAMDHSGHVGDLIHETMKDGYHLAYHLINMKAQMEAAKSTHSTHTAGMNMDKTHHLMVYLQPASGEHAVNAKVGYLIKNPDGTEQKVMCMGMSGGFGADVKLDQTGNYTIKMKALINEQIIMDEFIYTVN